jgi:hypothetical protein
LKYKFDWFFPLPSSANMSYLEVGVSICVGISTLAGFFFIKQRPRTTGEKLPAKQRRLVLLEAAGDLAKAKIAVQDADIPKPRSGEVLIKMASAPVNPSDFASWMQKAGDDPVVMGNEGAGTVIASGGGVVAGSMVGKKSWLSRWPKLPTILLRERDDKCLASRPNDAR